MQESAFGRAAKQDETKRLFFAEKASSSQRGLYDGVAARLSKAHTKYVRNSTKMAIGLNMETSPMQDEVASKGKIMCGFNVIHTRK